MLPSDLGHAQFWVFNDFVRRRAGWHAVGSPLQGYACAPGPQGIGKLYPKAPLCRHCHTLSRWRE